MGRGAILYVFMLVCTAFAGRAGSVVQNIDVLSAGGIHKEVSFCLFTAGSHVIYDVAEVNVQACVSKLSCDEKQKGAGRYPRCNFITYNFCSVCHGVNNHGPAPSLSSGKGLDRLRRLNI